MEDDDEFGDLYTDVLRPLTTTSAPAQSTVATSSSRAIDLNTIHGGDDDEILYGAAAPITNSNPSNFKISLDGQQTLAQDPFTSDLAGNSIKGPEKEGNSVGTGSRVLDKEFEDPNFMDESGIDIVVEERDDDKDVNLENFEGNSGIDINSNNLGNLEPVITGLSMPRVSENGGLGEGDDWGDSDSEDDLQIVLNDNTRIMGMDRGGEEDDGEDEDGDNLVILADTDPNHHQPMEEQEWGEDAAQGAAEGGGERKDLGDSTAKINGAAVAQTKIGYSGFHHPFHSQFKYVRPGAPPLPGAAPVASGGPPCQVRPPVGIVPFAGRGRGDWRPTGIRGAAPIQKNFPGYGMPAWGNSGSGRGFGSGLEFTLPSHKTIFEVDIDSFEEKPWRLPGIDISDFFNFGLNEESWKEYCKQLEQLRLEATMQSKIRVYESGRSEQEYDPDLPPELAAAAGIHDISAETPNLGKVDPGQGDLAKGSIRVRPQPPPGRAIQVETGYGERLPSIDTRPPRIRDSDAIIEIVLQDSGYDDSSPGNNIVEQPYNNPSRENTRRVNEHEENTAPDETNGFEGEPVQDLRDSRGKSSAFSGRKFNITPDERRTKNQVSDRSPVSIHSASTQDKKLIDDQKEESLESVGAKPSPSSSPVTGGSVEDHDFDQNDAIHDGPVPADGSSEMGREEALDTTTADKLENETRMHSVKKQKLISRAEPPSHRELDEGEDSKAARSSDNSRARSGSSRDYRNTGDGVDDEVVQAGRSRHLGMGKRPPDEDERMVRGRGRDERQEMEKHRAQMKGKEDSYSSKKWESNMTHHSHVKNESLGRRKDGDSDGVWQRKDDDIQGGRPKAEDKRKRERGDEMVSGHRSKVRENERSDKDEHQLRKVLDNGSWKGYHEKDSLLRHKDRDDNLKNQNDIMDDPHSKRRKDERREYAEKEETLHVHKESNSRRKRERDEILDQRKREDLPRLRDDDQHAVRHNKEEVWLQRERVERKKERDEWHRLKQSHDENLIKREKEEVRGGMRSGRVVEDKAWAGHSRVKEEYKAPDREYQIKDSGRHSEQLNRRDRVENDSLSRHRGRDGAYARGNQLGSEERRSRQERGSAGTDRPVGASDNHRAQEKKHRENTRKSKESDIADRNSLPPSRRNRGDHGGQRSERVSLGGMLEQGSGEHDFPVNRQASRKHKEDASSDDEQRDSKKGRSKLERWTSHKERDFTVGIKPSASTNVKEIDRYNDVSSLVSKDPDESFKAEETIENSEPLAELKDDGLTEFKNDDSKPAEDKDKHLDTVQKLKKRSERFKLPMPSEKETLAIKKIENEPLPSVQVETLADSEVKHERPTRKRRWTSS